MRGTAAPLQQVSTVQFMTQSRTVLWSGECGVSSRFSAPTYWIFEEKWEKVWAFIFQSWIRAMSSRMERRPMRNFGEESTKAKCCTLDVRYLIESLVSPLEELWPRGGCQEHGWGRLGLLTSTWLLQKRARLSEQDLCEECLKSCCGVQTCCAELLVNPGFDGHYHLR